MWLNFCLFGCLVAIFSSQHFFYFFSLLFKLWILLPLIDDLPLITTKCFLNVLLLLQIDWADRKYILYASWIFKYRQLHFHPCFFFFNAPPYRLSTSLICDKHRNDVSSNRGSIPQKIEFVSGNFINILWLALLVFLFVSWFYLIRSKRPNHTNGDDWLCFSGFVNG